MRGCHRGSSTQERGRPAEVAERVKLKEVMSRTKKVRLLLLELPALLSLSPN